MVPGAGLESWVYLIDLYELILLKIYKYRQKYRQIFLSSAYYLHIEPLIPARQPHLGGTPLLSDGTPIMHSVSDVIERITVCSASTSELLIKADKTLVRTLILLIENCLDETPV